MKALTTAVDGGGVETVMAAEGAYATGHEFHGNQWTEKADAATALADQSGLKEDHDKAAQANLNAHKAHVLDANLFFKRHNKDESFKSQRKAGEHFDKALIHNQKGSKSKEMHAATDAGVTDAVRATWSDAAREAAKEARKNNPQYSKLYDEAERKTRIARQLSGIADKEGTSTMHLWAGEAHSQAAKEHLGCKQVAKDSNDRVMQEYHRNSELEHSQKAEHHKDQFKLQASDNTMDNNIVHCRVEAGAEISTSIPWVADRQVKFCWCPGGVHTITAGFSGPVTKFRESALTLTVGVVPDRDAPVCQKSMDEIKAAKQGQEPYGCYEHDEKKASVWADNFESGKDPVYGIPSIILAGRPSGDGADDVNKKNWRRWSPSFGTDADYEKCQCSACDKAIAECDCRKPQLTFPDGVRGSQSNPARITGVAFVLGTLTNRPAFTAMPPVRASRAVEDGHDVVRAGQADGTVKAAGTSEGAMEGWKHRQRAFSATDAANQASLKALNASEKHGNHVRAAKEHFEARDAHYKAADEHAVVAHEMHAQGKSHLEASHDSWEKVHAEAARTHHKWGAGWGSKIAASDETTSTTVQATWSDAAREASAEKRKGWSTSGVALKSKEAMGEHDSVAKYLRSAYIGDKYKPAQMAGAEAHEASAKAYQFGKPELHSDAAKQHRKAAEMHHANGASGAGKHHEEVASEHDQFAGTAKASDLLKSIGTTDKTATILASVKTTSERQKELMSSIQGGHSRKPSSEEVLARIMASNGLGSAAAAGLKRQCPACQCEAKAQDKTCSQCGARLPAQVAIKNMTDEEATNAQDTPSNRATAETRMM